MDDVELVLEAAGRLLEARPRSTAEVRSRLRRAGYRADLVDAAVDRLTSAGYLDDAAFARSWIESRDRARPRGETALRRELQLKGVDRAIVDAALDRRRGASLAEPSAADEPGSVDVAVARRLLERHARALARVVDARLRRRRAYALLARNGFDPDVCARLSQELSADGAAGPVGPSEADGAEGPPGPEA